MKFHRIVITLLLLFVFASPGLATEQVFFYHTDPAGTPLSMTDYNGNVVWTADYKPFGEEHAASGTADNSKRFVGKEKDEETGLSYFGARYEDARTGRFISVDPVRVVDPMTSKTNEKLLLNPQRLNVYAYALNNPYRYVDPDGREPLLNDVMSRVVSSETFIRFGEAIGASNLNAALTGYDFRGNEFSGFERAGQLAIALTSAPISAGNKIANGHAFEKHGHQFKEFGINTREEFSTFVSGIMKNAKGADVKQLDRGRTAYWDNSTGTVVIHNSAAKDAGTAFRPTTGKNYFTHDLK